MAFFFFEFYQSILGFWGIEAYVLMAREGRSFFFLLFFWFSMECLEAFWRGDFHFLFIYLLQVVSSFPGSVGRMNE